MTDPWEDVRKEFEGVGDPFVDALLTDADALLAVVAADREYDAAQAEWYDALVNTNDHKRQELANERIGTAKDVRREALEALPEHLK